MSFDVFDADYYERGEAVGKSNYHDYSWKRLGTHFADTAKHIHDHFRPKTALDVGCAKGFLVYALGRLGVDAYGIDPSVYAVANAITDRVKPGTVQEIPFPDNTFDLVTCFDVLEHIPEDDSLQACLELLRVCRGTVIAHILTRYVDWDIDITHQNIHPRDWWEEMFRKAGGRVESAGPYHRPGIWWFNEIQYMVIVTK